MGIFYKGDTINQITYDQYLNTDSFPAASYQLFSNVIANQGYTNWQGYYEDPTEVDIIPKVVNGKNYSSAQIAQNRKELCNKISNESLRQLNSSQYYVETFIYTHKDNSRWEGRICLFTSHYTSDKDEEKTTNNIKDIILLFSLDRIK